MKRKIFTVEQKSVKLPDVAWKIVFEREIDLTSLCFLFLVNNIVLF